MSVPTRGIPGRIQHLPVCGDELSSGGLVAGRFRLERKLGEGGMGTVWAARHVVTERAVAIKVLKPPANADLIDRFLREARAANVVKHPNVIQVHDVFELDDGMPAMVLDLLEGESLGELLEKGALPLAELVRVMSAILSAVAAIHAAGIVHRDLKPANIFMASQADGSTTPMILDFGICKLEARAGLLHQSDVATTAGRLIGTPCYMAPEQVRGSVDVDARADIWSLGVILFECATGSCPFNGNSLAQVVAAVTTQPIPRLEELAPQLPQALANVIGRMLTREPQARLNNLGEVRNALVALPSSSAAPRPAAAQASSSERAARQAKTALRAASTTLDRGALSQSMPPLADGRARAHRYLASGVTLALALASIVLLQRCAPASASSGASRSVLATNSIAVAPAAPTPPPAAPGLGLAPATEPETPAKAAAKPPRKVPTRPHVRRLANGIQDFGGRR